VRVIPFVLVPLSLSLFLSGCRTARPTHGSPLVLAIDRSESTAGSERANYLEHTAELFESAADSRSSLALWVFDREAQHLWGRAHRRGSKTLSRPSAPGLPHALVRHGAALARVSCSQRSRNNSPKTVSPPPFLFLPTVG
jgi:hypothetical protein